MFATRIATARDEKRALGALPLGPGSTSTGRLAPPDPAQEPARSSVVAGRHGHHALRWACCQRHEQQSQHKLVLLYSTARDTAFLAELQALVKRDPRFHLMKHHDRHGPFAAAWEGSAGHHRWRLRAARHCRAGHAVVLRVRPPALVGAMQNAWCRAAWTEDDVRAAGFFEY